MESSGRRNCVICGYNISDYAPNEKECGACVSMLARDYADVALMAYIAERGPQSDNLLDEAIDLSADLDELIIAMREGLWETRINKE